MKSPGALLAGLPALAILAGPVLVPHLPLSSPPSPSSPRSSSPHTRTVPGLFVSLSWRATRRPFTRSARPRNNNNSSSSHHLAHRTPSTAPYSRQSQHSLSPSTPLTSLPAELVVLTFPVHCTVLFLSPPPPPPPYHV